MQVRAQQTLQALTYSQTTVVALVWRSIADFIEQGQVPPDGRKIAALFYQVAGRDIEKAAHLHSLGSSSSHNNRSGCAIPPLLGFSGGALGQKSVLSGFPGGKKRQQ